jgi:hypothetical protein
LEGIDQTLEKDIGLSLRLRKDKSRDAGIILTDFLSSSSSRTFLLILQEPN